VLNSWLARALEFPETEGYALSLHTLAHEAAHAHDNDVLARTVPELLGRPMWDFRKVCLLRLAHSCWSEYIASHLSARWGTETYCADMEPDLCSMLSTARDRGRACIYAFQKVRNFDNAEAEMRNEIYGRVFVRASNLIGHTHAIDSTIEETAPQFHKLVNETPWFKPVFERYESNLREMHSTYGSWAGVDTFNPLIATCETLLNEGGMYYTKLPNGNYYVRLDFPK
jgi:hypothetical protein